jgi:hypothetical protein
MTLFQDCLSGIEHFIYKPCDENKPHEEYWIVKLPLEGDISDPDILAWLEERFGDQEWGNWIMGEVSIGRYQEYWFDDQANAIETYLTWNPV